MEKTSGVYKITNTVTGDFYIGSSNNVKRRWACHKCPSRWEEKPNNPMYQDMKKYGVEKFDFQILEEVEIESLKEKEQWFIEKLHPTYNSNRANGWDIERYKKFCKEYNNQLCFYNGDILTLAALAKRFERAEIKYCVLEAKKYIIPQNI